MTKAEGTKHGSLIAQQMLDVAVRVLPIRHFAVSQMACLIDNANMVLIGSSQYRSDLSSVLYAAAWICGEFSEHLPDPQGTIEAMLRTKTSMMPGKIQSVYCYLLMLAYETESDWDRIYSLNNLLLSKLPQFLSSDYLETQERVIQCFIWYELVCDDLKALFAGDLNPVAPKAQRKLPIPEGLAEIESNPHYLKPSKTVARDSGRKYSKESLESYPEVNIQLDKPLGIINGIFLKGRILFQPVPIVPGMLGLEHYEKNLKRSSRRSHDKKKKKGHRHRSSSLSDPERFVQYEIYQGDGEMPENATVTDEEKTSLNEFPTMKYDTLNT
ncbi:AP-3 complex subunit delta-1 [Trichuris trichiura]|uniref:AP-3 complex subunit delta-1 n=1 Tax=Trichuris trichiura TaxID=36087 RepID=A0A077ZGK3_TRITR|nr:AP-3 complex subunit delta-1 [Trichuris trichiura]